jgi:hypothetical protein
LSVLALVDLALSERKTVFLAPAGRKRAATMPAATVHSTPAGFTLTNDRVAIEAGPSLDPLRVRVADGVWASTAPSFELELEGGTLCRARWSRVDSWTEGPLRSGLVDPDGREEFAAEFRIEQTAAQPWIECRHRLIRQLPGGGPGNIRRLTISQQWDLENSACLLRQLTRGEEWLPRDVCQRDPVRIRVTGQGARVTDHAMVGEDPKTYPPYLQRGLDRVAPWVASADTQRLVLFWTPEPHGHSPQEWTVSNGRFTIDLIPASAAPTAFPQGRAKTHRWRWHFAAAPAATTTSARPQDRPKSVIESLALLHQQPPLAAVDPDWARACGVAQLDGSLAWTPARHPRFEGILNHLFDLKWPAGMMDWGDDVEPGYTQGYNASGMKPAGAVWTNNEYDFLFAVLHQMLRTGQSRLWAVAERSARHAMDIDFMHYSDDPWLHHGSPAHCAGHTTAASYPSHIWTEGLLHYYYLSADREALETARLSGAFILRYMDQRWWVFEETARESGWALIALAELYAATGETRFLEGARRIAALVIDGTSGKDPLFPGDASFFIGVLVIGLDRLHAIAPDKRLPVAIDRMLQWRLTHRLSPEGIPLYHWDAGARMVNTREIIFPAALAIGYRHTRRKGYLDALWRCLQYWLDTDVFYGEAACTKHAAAVYRTWVESFHELAASGLLRRLEYSTRKR